MAQLAILGHATRGKEVIEILEMLGGINECDYRAKHDSFCYYIGNENNIICYDWMVDCCEDEDTLVFTLEEFLEKFPYKVGDKVLYKTHGIYSVIKTMKWNAEKEQVFYRLDSKKLFVATVDELKPCKEETMENKPNLLQRLKEHFDNTPRDVLEKEWNEFSYLNEIGPTIDQYLECVKKYRQPKYPKTYKECCDVLGLSTMDNDAKGYKVYLIIRFQELLIARDAYWKIAGEQMGLGKPWEFENPSRRYVFTIENFGGNILKNAVTARMLNRILVFPTEEMRDAFYENFKELIEECKELL